MWPLFFFKFVCCFIFGVSCYTYCDPLVILTCEYRLFDVPSRPNLFLTSCSPFPKLPRNKEESKYKQDIYHFTEEYVFIRLLKKYSKPNYCLSFCIRCPCVLIPNYTIYISVRTCSYPAN